MAYLEDHARSWPSRRRAKAIERSVDQAVAQVAAFEAGRAEVRRELIARARAAVEALPQSHLAALGAKHGLSRGQAKAMLLSAAATTPELSLRASENTMRKLAEA